jgi:carbamoyltransferase
MKVLALGQSHDFNACLYDTETKFFKYIKDERLSGKKHSFDHLSICNAIKEHNFTFDHIVICFGDFLGNRLYSDSIASYKKQYEDLRQVLKKYDKMYKASQGTVTIVESLIQQEYIREKTSKNPLAKEQIPRAGNLSKFEWFNKYIEIVLGKIIKFARINLPDFNHVNVTSEWVHHHYAHGLSGWILDRNKFKDISYCVTIDGRAFDGTTVLVTKNTFDTKKVEMLFTSRILEYCKETDSLKMNKGASFGGCWGKIGEILGFEGARLDYAGKIMGLNAYGAVDQAKVDKFKDYEWNITNIGKIFNEVKKDTNIQNYTKRPLPPRIRSAIATFNQIWSDTILYIFKKYIPKDEKVIFSGGCAQNTVLNYRLKKEFPNLIVVPHCYDGGLSLGSLAYYLLKNDLPMPDIKNYPYIQSDIAPDTEPTDDTIKTVARMLSDGKIVGWYQGHGECGPRALGNRSILMNPSHRWGKKKINDKIKHREYWRPFSPSVLQEESSKWFTMKESKYMMYAAEVLEDKRELIPAVTHQDNTSRIQTVSKRDNKSFYNLLTQFYSLTEIPLLLNTSLNDNGLPIFGTPEQALKFFYSSKLDAICIGNKLYTKHEQLKK